jgi:aldose 1-epimerase
LNGVEYQLLQNDGENTLHGGPTGFQYQMFDITQIDAQTLECTYLSPNGDNGFPGNLNVKVTYKLTNNNAIDISYSAETDQATVINLTNHAYFNLSGNPNNPIVDHILYLNCNQYTPTDAALIPTGEIADVKGTPMDFTTPTVIGERIDDKSYQALEFGNGYDHNWIINCSNIETLACKAVSPITGITLEVYTIEPAVQFYAGNFLDGTQTGKNGIVYQQRTGFCLETQHYPDSPNHPHFPSTILNPGEEYVSRCIYKFGIE